MKINFVSYNNGYGLTKDMQILKNILHENYDNLDIQFCDYYDHKIRNADINIFFEIISNIIIQKAKYNILIPNQEWFYESWIPYLKNIDLVLAKTKYSYNIFSKFLNTEFIGWESEDLLDTQEKDYKSFFHCCGKSMYKQTQFLIDNWKPSYPDLTIVYQKDKLDFIQIEQENINYISHKLNNEEFKRLINNKSVHICCSETEGFGHYINEARSCKSVVITTNAEPMNNFISDEKYLVNVKKKKKLDNVLCYRNIIDKISFKNTIEDIINTDQKELEKNGEINRQNFIADRMIFRRNIKNVFEKILSSIPPLEIKKSINQNNLPYISVVTITRNRERFIKLCLLNTFSSNYPQDKIEWVIIDDSDKSIENSIPKNNFIKYYYYNKTLNIGNKRNIGIEKSSHDYILFMDDDDYYPPESFSKRITSLIQHDKECVFCSSIGCFHINKYISIMNVPPHQLPFHERVSEATLCFKKKFWEEKKFLNDCKGAEGSFFLKDRYSQCLEIPPENIIVSLLHDNNTSHKELVINKPNGCHFNFSDKLFSFVTQLDKKKDINKQEILY